MYKSTFGTKNQIQFSDEHEYYELLGFLAKSDGTTSLVWEHNEEQGAWGSEGRIEFFDAPPVTLSASLTHTAGNGGSVLSRVNCNEFVQNLNENHDFEMGDEQDETAIRDTIPDEYLDDFDRGLNL